MIVGENTVDDDFVVPLQGEGERSATTGVGERPLVNSQYTVINRNSANHMGSNAGGPQHAGNEIWEGLI